MLMNGEKVDGRRNRKVTTGATSAALGIYCAMNKEMLEGKSLQTVAGILRKHFNGEVVSDRAILSALDAAGVTVTRRASPAGVNRKSSIRAVAGIMARLCESIEKAIGAQPNTLLSAADLELLSKIRGGHPIE